MKKPQKRKKNLLKVVAMLVFACLGVTALLFYMQSALQVKRLKNVEIPDYIDVQLIDIGSSREGRELKAIKNIVIHYVGNPGTSAQQNHDYFANDGTTVNSHFIVGLKGEIIQCVPIYERSAATNHRNKDTISIEVCHPDEGGKFNTTTRNALIKLTAWLCEITELKSKDIIRHYDVTGKMCPLYYVEHEAAWEQLLTDIEKYIKKESKN